MRFATPWTPLPVNEQSIFAEALKRAPSEREEFIAAACGSDLSLKSRVAARLAAELKKQLGEEQTAASIKPQDLAGQTTQPNPPQSSDSPATRDHQLGKVLKRLLPKMSLFSRIDLAGNHSGDSSLSGETPVSTSQTESRYELHGEIARGGMGAIFHGRDLDLGRDLAVKVLLDEHKNNPEILGRFVAEAQIAGQLQHPGIAPVYELGQLGDERPFFSMKLVKGKTLAELLQARETPEEDRPKYLNIFLQIANTLAYAHSLGVIHRDMKPSNVMIGKFGEVQVMDWGLAKVLSAKADQGQGDADTSVIATLRTDGSIPKLQSDSQTMSGSVMGTPAYMPPEQAKGDVGKLDERADVFGLGAILCEILTEAPPYVADTSTEVFRLAAVGDLVECFKRLEGCQVDEELVQLTRDCLEPDLRSRPRNASHVADRMGDFLRSVDERLKQAELKSVSEKAQAEEALETAKQANERARAERRLRRVQAGLALVVLLVTATTAVLSSIFLKHQRDQSVRLQSALDAKSDYLYVAQMQMSDQAWRDGSIVRLRKLLNQHIPAPGEIDRRDAGWHLLDLYCQSSERVPSIHYGDIVSRVEVAPNNRYFAVMGNDANIKLYDFATQELLTTLSGHQRKVENVVISPDGRTIVSSDWDEFRVWQVPPNRSISNMTMVLEGSASKPYSMRMLPSGNYALVPKWNEDRQAVDELQVIDLATPAPAIDTLVFDSEVNDVVCYPSGKYVAVALRSGELLQYAVATGEKVRDIATIDSGADQIDFSDNGQYLVAANNSTVQVFDLQQDGDSKLKMNLGAPSGRLRTLLALKSTFALACSDGVTTYRYEEPERAAKIDVPEEVLISRSGDGESLAVFATDNLVSVYSPVTGNLISQSKGHSNIVYCVTFAPNGLILSGSRDKTVRLQDGAASPTNPLVLNGHRGKIWCVDFSPDGSLLASASEDHNVIIWNTETGQEITRLSDHQRAAHTARFSPTEDLLATCSADASIMLWDTRSWKKVGECLAHTAKVNGLAFSDDGKSLASVSDDGSVIVWDIAKRQSIASHQMDDGYVWSVDFSSGGEIVFGGTNLQVHRWDYRAKTSPVLLNAFEENVTSVVISPSDDTVACTTADGLISMMDYPFGEITAQPIGHSSDAMITDFSPDGRSLVSAGTDGQVQFWSLLLNEPTARIMAHANHIHHLAFSPNGLHLATSSWDHTVKIWKIKAPPDNASNTATNESPGRHATR